MQNNPFLQDNLHALNANSEPIIRWLAQQKVDVDAVENNFFSNRWKIRDWKMENGQGLFEALPPSVHYRGWNADEANAATSATVVVGCNIGYGLNQVLDKTPNSHKVLVVEPNPTMLVACLGQTDYTPYIKLKKLFFLVPDEAAVQHALFQADVQFLFGQIYLRPDGPSQQLGPEYARWTRYVREQLENFSVELATLRLRQDTMVNNELRNFKRAMADGSVNPLRDAAKGLTAVILGAGPSLAEYAPALAGRRGDALLATALQTMPALQRLGLKPDLAMAIDYSEGMLAVFDKLDPEFAKDVPLIYSTKLKPEVVAKYPGPTLPMWTKGGLGTFTLNHRELILDAGGNVSVALFRFLAWCGIGRFALAGQDFAWKGESSHVSGHHAQGFKHPKTLSMQNRYGETIHSTLSYITGLRDLEKSIAETGLPTYNLYGGGAEVKGATHVTLQELDEQKVLQSLPYAGKRFRDAMAEARKPQSHPGFPAKAGLWTDALRNAQKRLDKLFKKLDKKQTEIWETLQQLHKYLRHDPLYLPYLFNELMDVAGLLYGGRRFELKDLTTFKHIVKRILAKVREIDALLAPEGAQPVAYQPPAREKRQPLVTINARNAA